MITIIILGLQKRNNGKCISLETTTGFIIKDIFLSILISLKITEFIFGVEIYHALKL